jgi:hypothetical protein
MAGRTGTLYERPLLAEKGPQKLLSVPLIYSLFSVDFFKKKKEL